jgi:four helix bundle protein
MDLAVLVFDLSSKFPPNQNFGLVSQITKCVASVPANIAEGRARATRRDYLHFVAIANGSLMETETYLTLAVRLNYLANDEARPAFDLVTEIAKMLGALRKRLKD